MPLSAPSLSLLAELNTLATATGHCHYTVQAMLGLQHGRQADGSEHVVYHYLHTLFTQVWTGHRVHVRARCKLEPWRLAWDARTVTAAL